jgi:hypothetical protein
MREGQNARKFTKQSLQSRNALMQRERRLGLKKHADDEKLNERKKKSRGSVMRRDALSNARSTTN